MLSYHTLSCCCSSYLMMPLEFLISFVLPLQVVFGGAGEGGESGEGRPRKKYQVLKKFLRVGKSLHMFSSSSLCHIQSVSQSYSGPIYLLLIQSAMLSRGEKGEKIPFGKKKNLKSARKVFYRGRGKL